MNEEQSLWAIRAILKLEERVYNLEHPAKLDLPKIEPERIPGIPDGAVVQETKWKSYGDSQ